MCLWCLDVAEDKILGVPNQLSNIQIAVWTAVIYTLQEAILTHERKCVFLKEAFRVYAITILY